MPTAGVVCQIMADGVTAMLDFSWSQWADIVDVIVAAKIPYFPVDISVRPFVGVLTKFLAARNGVDAVVIFQNENGNSIVPFKYVFYRVKRGIFHRYLLILISTLNIN